MRFDKERDAIDYIFKSHHRRKQVSRALPPGSPLKLDEHTRKPELTRRIMQALGLPGRQREYIVVTGSKGKGSTATIAAKLLQSLGHRTGTITSPHLVTWYERIRINGQAIPESDFLRILTDLKPEIDLVDAQLSEAEYISPQGIFLLIALRWFDEQGVAAAVLEVGRGGRFDDVALVPNRVSLFTPIMLEHAQYMGNSVERIAWHKSGIIKPSSSAISVPQSQSVLDILRQEAQELRASFHWLAKADMGEYLGDTPDGIRVDLPGYGECELPLLGRYQIENVALALQGVAQLHQALGGLRYSSDAYSTQIQAGLAAIRWPGRLHKLQATPAVYVDGAINVKSAEAFLHSLEARLTPPVVIVAGVPDDRDYDGVYRILAEKADALILTETDIHPNIHFPQAEIALATAQQYHADVTHTEKLPQALASAYDKAGTRGSVLLCVAQPLVGEAMLIWKIDTRSI